MSDPTIIPTESVEDCTSCDKPNTITVHKDPRTGDWAYLFECWSCHHINDEHGTREDRGAVSPAASFWLFITAVVGIVLFLYQPVIFWTLIGVTVYAALVLAIIALFHGAKQEEADHE